MAGKVRRLGRRNSRAGSLGGSSKSFAALANRSLPSHIS